MLLDFKDSLDKKLSKDDKAENKDEAEDSSDIDEEELERQLNTPGLKQQQAIREKPSLLGNAKWYDKLFFSWTYKIIEVSVINTLYSKYLIFCIVFTNELAHVGGLGRIAK